MAEGEINEVAGKEVVTEDMDYAKVKDKVIKPKKRVAGETGLELSSNEKLRAQFSTVGNRKNHEIFKRWSKAESQNHNQAKDRMAPVESEARSLGN
jgi:hypothetical protein